MRLALLSDIHGNLIALDAVLADLAGQGTMDAYWLLGDYAAHGTRPTEVIQRVRALPNASFLSGNTDRYLVSGARGKVKPQTAETYPTFAADLRSREAVYAWGVEHLAWAEFEFLAGLRGELEMNIPGYGWLLGYHGTPGNDEGLLYPDTPTEEVLDHLSDREGRLGVGGHTHRPMDRDFGAWRVVNPGSVGLPHGGQEAQYAIATFEGGSLTLDMRRVAFDWEAVIADAHALAYPDVAWLAEWLTKRTG